MKRCKCCRKTYGDEYDGVFVREGGVVTMGYGSRHDGNQYKFTLVPAWYCYKCLDYEIEHDLCQPLWEQKR